MAAAAAELQRSIVEPAAHPQSPALRIDADQGDDDLTALRWAGIHRLDAPAWEGRRCSGALEARRAARSCLRRIAFIEMGWRHPQMPFWTVAPDLSNRWG